MGCKLRYFVRDPLQKKRIQNEDRKRGFKMMTAIEDTKNDRKNGPSESLHKNV